MISLWLFFSTFSFPEISSLGMNFSTSGRASLPLPAGYHIFILLLCSFAMYGIYPAGNTRYQVLGSLLMYDAVWILAVATSPGKEDFLKREKMYWHNSWITEKELKFLQKFQFFLCYPWVVSFSQLSFHFHLRSGIVVNFSNSNISDLIVWLLVPYFSYFFALSFEIASFFTFSVVDISFREKIPPLFTVTNVLIRCHVSLFRACVEIIARCIRRRPLSKIIQFGGLIIL